jgi:hypothetical protein
MVVPARVPEPGVRDGCDTPAHGAAVHPGFGSAPTQEGGGSIARATMVAFGISARDEQYFYYRTTRVNSEYLTTASSFDGRSYSQCRTSTSTRFDPRSGYCFRAMGMTPFTSRETHTPTRLLERVIRNRQIVLAPEVASARDEDLFPDLETPRDGSHGPVHDIRRVSAL